MTSKHQGVLDVALEPIQEPQPQTPASDVALMFERLAKDPAVDVEKLERLIAMQERIMRHNAKAAFDADFSVMQPEIPVIDEHGRIEVKGTLRSTYAPLEDIHKVIKPICARFGFAVRHRTEWPDDRKGIIRIVGILSHKLGHSEESVFEAPMDKSDYRTDIQSMGSTVSYGRRYTTMDLLNISTKKMDNDGARREAPKPEAPDGYDEWWLDLEACADEGLPKLTAAWNKSKREFCKDTAAYRRLDWEDLKRRAAKGGQA
jgi:hypothetical protein